MGKLSTTIDNLAQIIIDNYGQGKYRYSKSLVGVRGLEKVLHVPRPERHCSLPKGEQ